MAMLARDCDVISPADIDTVAGRKGRHVLVTFDDGYLDNYEVAYPILRRHGLPATFFIATGFIDRPRLPWWDEIAWRIRTTAAARLDLRPWLPEPLAPARGPDAAIGAILRAYKALPADEAARMLERLRAETGQETPERVDGLWMDWNQIREMAAGGMTIGGHTVATWCSRACRSTPAIDRDLRGADSAETTGRCTTSPIRWQHLGVRRGHPRMSATGSLPALRRPRGQTAAPIPRAWRWSATSA